MKKTVRFVGYSHFSTGANFWAITLFCMTILNMFVKCSDDNLTVITFVKGIIALIIFTLAYLLVLKHKTCCKGTVEGIFVYMYDELFFFPWHYVDYLDLKKRLTFVYFKKEVADYLKEFKLFDLFQESCTSTKLRFSFHAGDMLYFLKVKHEKICELHKNYRNTQSIFPHRVKKLHPFIEPLLIVSLLLLGFYILIKM